MESNATMKDQEKELDNKSLSKILKKRCINCLKGPNILTTMVTVVCVAVVIQQISTCIGKLINIPITTYTHFEFNETLLYPSVTFCREPPYKYEKLLEYGLYLHPRYTSIWREFDFNNISLDQLWDEITYSDVDFFAQYGLDGAVENVQVSSTMGFMLGKCHTLSPKLRVSRATPATGYSVTLLHSALDVANSLSIYPPGYHVFVHYHREPFTEVQVNNGGLVDYIYISTGENIDVKLTVDEYVKISGHKEYCNVEYTTNSSANECTTRFVWNLVMAATDCSGPWMETNIARCDNFTTMRDLIINYIDFYENHNCSVCPRSCRSYMYSAHVTNRQSNCAWDQVTKQWTRLSGDQALQMQLMMHFNSMMVSVYEERYNYDWSLFLSDLGGSIGFLLGLSVIGFISIVSKFSSRLCIKKAETDAISVSCSTITTDIKVISDTEEYILKCKQWDDKITQ